jgi:hypothetical protein
VRTVPAFDTDDTAAPALPAHGMIQVAFAVRDVERAVARFHAATGAGPSLLRRHVEVPTLTYFDQDTRHAATLDHSIALGQWER